MTTDSAELSSIVSQIEELARRLESMSQPYLESDRAEVAARLVEVERALATAARRLVVLQRSMS